MEKIPAPRGLALLVVFAVIGMIVWSVNPRLAHRDELPNPLPVSSRPTPAHVPSLISLVCADNELPAQSSSTLRVISVDLQDTEAENALRIFAELSNTSIVAMDKLNERITCRVVDAPWDEIMERILRPLELVFLEKGNVIKVYRKEDPRFRTQPDLPADMGRPISIEVSDAPARGILRQLLQTENHTQVGELRDDCQAALRLKDVPWKQVVSLLAEQCGYIAAFEEGRVILNRLQ